MSRYLKHIKAAYATDYERRHKVCVYCQVQFCDITTWSYRQTCSRVCGNKHKIAKARTGGAYVWDVERRKANAVAVGLNQASGKVSNPWTRSDVKLRIAETNLSRYGVVHFSQTLEAKQKLANRNRMIPASMEERRKHSRNAILQMKSGIKSRGKAGKRPDLPGFYRSAWEANYARILQLLGKNWEYEAKTFELKSGITYTPDFLVEGTWIEIKGWFDPMSKRKLAEFSDEFPFEKLQIIGPSEYLALKAHYKPLLVNWE